MANFTLDEAINILPEVKQTTQFYYKKIDQLEDDLDSTESNQETRELKQQVNYLFSNWVRELNTLGVQVQDPWTVHIDSGDGIYYCWQYGEDSLSYFHQYNSECRQRVPIDKLKH